MWTEIAVSYPYFFSLNPGKFNSFSESGSINLEDHKWWSFEFSLLLPALSSLASREIGAALCGNELFS